MPFDLDRIVSAELHTVVPKLKRNVGWSKIDFYHIVNTVILWLKLPPVPVLKLEHCQRHRGEIRVDFADRLAGWKSQL